MRRRTVERLALVSALLGIFGICHQGIRVADWFNWSQFWHHESLIAICFICSISLLAGRYITLRWQDNA